MISFLCRVIILLAVIVAYSKTAANLLNKINLHTSKSLVTSTSIDKLVDIKGGKIKPKAKSKSKKDSGNNKVRLISSTFNFYILY